MANTSLELFPRFATDQVRTVLADTPVVMVVGPRERAMLRLFRLLSQHSGQLTNYSKLSGSVGLDDKTARKYVGILKSLYVLQLVEPWF